MLTIFGTGSDMMIPLNFAQIGKECVIKKIGGSPEVRKHLENLGFSIGGNATVINTIEGNVIVKVKESRVALDSRIANKIMI